MPSSLRNTPTHPSTPHPLPLYSLNETWQQKHFGRLGSANSSAQKEQKFEPKKCSIFRWISSISSVSNIWAVGIGAHTRWNTKMNSPLFTVFIASQHRVAVMSVLCLCCVCVLGQNTISYQFINLIVSQFDVIFSHKFLRFLFVFSSHSVTLCCVPKAASCDERRRFGWMWGTESST